MGDSFSDGLIGYKGNDFIYGYGGDDVIWGDVGNDTIYGGADDDSIDGGEGKDTLAGGTGYDNFYFGSKLSASNMDVISDFSIQDDTILLSSSFFPRLAGDGNLSDNFVIGTKALDSNDYLIFNPVNGVLSYDSDGSGKAKALAFVTLTGVQNLDAYRDIGVF